MSRSLFADRIAIIGTEEAFALGPLIAEVEAESGRPLAGASVTVRGTSLATVTDARGQFIIPVVPAGVHTVVVAYLGRETREQEVTVTAGTVARLDVELASQALELVGIQVLGARALVQAEALTRQKNAPNIINVVASDQMGRFPDASAPEAVQRIPGVAVARDQGEGRYIQIRGGSPANTQVNMNGAGSVPNLKSSGKTSDSRAPVRSTWTGHSAAANQSPPEAR